MLYTRIHFSGGIPTVSRWRRRSESNIVPHPCESADMPPFQVVENEGTISNSIIYSFHICPWCSGWWWTLVIFHDLRNKKTKRFAYTNIYISVRYLLRLGPKIELPFRSPIRTILFRRYSRRKKKNYVKNVKDLFSSPWLLTVGLHGICSLSWPLPFILSKMIRWFLGSLARFMF